MGLGDVEDGLEIEGDVGTEVQLVLVVLSATGEELEEALMLLVTDFVLGSGPDGLDQVDCLSVDGDGEVDEVGVLLHDLLDLRLLHELALRLFDVQHDLGSSGESLLFDLLDLVCSTTIRRPLVRHSACFPRSDLHQVADDEGRVETHSELSDDVILGITTSWLTFAFQSLHEFLGAGAGDSA